MKFEKLRLVGFKSFVEPTDFEIRPGLTGIVGPNGCGKSNLLEALRWVMGATSAKALRGGGMEDVIFAGTTDRPARNWAEVILTVMNDKRDLPAEYNEHETLEVSRRILRKEEGSQSIYKINGKEVRARDIQLLFADASTGANSPALVRQGQISELINAKPQNRRKLLEEAAGITGLYTRRHEAELRLRAAETNLDRLNDVTGELETQRSTLARQARQATRYRNLSGDIRRTEAYVAYLRWQDATSALTEVDGNLAEVNTLVEEAVRVSATASAAQVTAHEVLEPLRQKEAETGAALHRLTVAMEGLDAELARAQGESERLSSEKEQLERDITRENDLGTDATQALEQLASEEEQLKARMAAETDRLTQAESAMADAAERQNEAEKTYDRNNQDAAELEAERRSLGNAVAATQGRVEKLNREHNRRLEEKEGLEPSTEQSQKLSILNNTAAEATEKLSTTEAHAARSEEALQRAGEREELARAPMQKSAKILTELQAEAETIARFLDTGDDTDHAALIEEIDVETGYETALAAALGDDLDAALTQEAATFWSSVGGEALITGQMPSGSDHLSNFVTAPPALARRLASIGVVEREEGDRLQADLLPGQRLVSREGDLWRWDGYVQRAEAKTAAAIRLEQRNRLSALKSDIHTAEQSAQKAEREFEESVSNRKAAQAERETARQELKTARQQKADADRALSDAEKTYERTSAMLRAVCETIERLEADRAEAVSELASAETALANLPDLTALRETVSAAREQLTTSRAQASETRAAFNDLSREAKMRADRLAEIARERGVWGTRNETANARISELQGRLEETANALAARRDAPTLIEEKRKSLFEQLEVAESRRRHAADELASAQTAAAEADKAVRASEAETSAAREERARLQAQLEAARTRVEEAVALARENCDAAPEELLQITEHKEGKDLPTREEVDRKLERYKRERENLGGVNLRADTEMEEIDTRLTEIVEEREDCEAAIRKLRSAIGNLNREGRQRLLDAFETVNQNFQRLFTKLFGGGSAELRLIDSEDPLEAGLEIFASPPGKKLTSMSLMSGGEQAMTATALIFAVFMSNPAPVCVLDEVDAPLDDANVDRFCQMLDEMSRETETKFITITHHALTMSRMDRLYGVTMIERGISQLVSVDLTAAEHLVAAE
ncbi:chromosome segregation protein SMC [Parvularcula sp. IMCC14364]|uniref:chromosome segregation protein SMC n=1 Tax=Parvularcula sp. IMCC14364 TaxID=3067902 RepID=UPI0027410CEE|nr:chromosome segregation protein SMC [Parvularcula sp. IMCC14364]